MKILRSWLLIGFLAATALRATEVTDLGQGLGYLRIHSIAESEAAFRKVVPGTAALVLDLRYVTADEKAADILRAAFAERPATASLFVLVSPATPTTLTSAIAAASAVTLGAPGAVPTPKVVVQTDAAADRRAYDAAESGTEIAKLISGRIEKERFDEATLVQEFKNGNHDAEPPPPVNPTAAKPDAAPAKDAPPATPTDRVLQRAVHLHRALQALRGR
jgi:hypothetical protein